MTMNNWKPFVLKEIGSLIVLIADGMVNDPDIVAQKLRQIAFKVSTNKKE
jgi:hypothetical protein